MNVLPFLVFQFQLKMVVTLGKSKDLEDTAVAVLRKIFVTDCEK